MERREVVGAENGDSDEGVVELVEEERAHKLVLGAVEVANRGVGVPRKRDADTALGEGENQLFGAHNLDDARALARPHCFARLRGIEERVIDIARVERGLHRDVAKALAGDARARLEGRRDADFTLHEALHERGLAAAGGEGREAAPPPLREEAVGEVGGGGGRGLEGVGVSALGRLLGRRGAGRGVRASSTGCAGCAGKCTGCALHASLAFSAGRKKERDESEVGRETAHKVVRDPVWTIKREIGAVRCAWFSNLSVIISLSRLRTFLGLKFSNLYCEYENLIQTVLPGFEIHRFYDTYG